MCYVSVMIWYLTAAVAISITKLSMLGLIVSLGLNITNDNGTQHLLYFTECCLQNVVFTSIVMLNAIMMSVGHPCNALSPCQSDHFS